MSDAPVLVEKRGTTTVATLNRPSRRNALSVDLVHDLQELLTDLRYDSDTRAVVLTGAGDKAFCAGADLKERATMSERDVRAFLRRLRRLMLSVEEMPQPVIAAINGYALGGGLELALCCDIRLAAASAKMGLTETRLAIIPGAGGTQRLPRAVGVSKAKELIFTGRRVDAAEAERIGLVSGVAADEDLLTEALALAAEIAEAGPLAVQQAKFAIDQGMRVDLRTGLEIEGKAYEVLIPTRDRIEALEAFAEKRKPEFEGR